MSPNQQLTERGGDDGEQIQGQYGAYPTLQRPRL